MIGRLWGQQAMAARQLGDPLCRQSVAVDRRDLVTETDGDERGRHRGDEGDAQGPQPETKALARGLGPE